MTARSPKSTRRSRSKPGCGSCGGRTRRWPGPKWGRRTEPNGARVARVHLRVANRRTDFLHKTTTGLARTKSAIAMETLNIIGMEATAGCPGDL
nr:transposase [Actinokineospora xionganensis]